MTSDGAIGGLGEEMACKALGSRGYQIIERNWRCRGDGFSGEIDIVARESECWVFVEVKTRRSQRVEPAVEAITPRKMERLERLAQQYLAEHDLHGVDWRIDLAAVQLDRGGRVRSLQIIPALALD